MLQSKELSAGAAAELAEVDRLTFATECQKHRIPLVDYPPEDLRPELAALRDPA
jgi:predicted HTH domain antitoxin